MTGYERSRTFFNWAFENPDLVRPQHIAIYFFAQEHHNRLGSKDKFAFPSQMTMEAVGISQYKTYIKYFRELISFGFIEILQESKNQYSANIISLPHSINALPKNTKALDKAFIIHKAKQDQSNIQSEGEGDDISEGESDTSITKQINNKPINKETKKPISIFLDDETFKRGDISKMGPKGKIRHYWTEEQGEPWKPTYNKSVDYFIAKIRKKIKTDARNQGTIVEPSDDEIVHLFRQIAESSGNWHVSNHYCIDYWNDNFSKVTRAFKAPKRNGKISVAEAMANMDPEFLME